MAAFRLRKNKPKPRLLISVRPIPTLVTLGNLLCGFAAILLAMQADNISAGSASWTTPKCLYYSGILIFLAMVFDVLDGRVARWTKSTSKFGMEMDSLSDVVSFGVAPAVLVKAALDYAAQTAPTFHIQERYVWLMLATYVACAALRLARYNVEAQSGHRDFFFGLPSPAAAGCVASLIITCTPLAENLGSFQPFRQPFTYFDLMRQAAAEVILPFLPLLMLCLGILMVSRVHYIHLGDRLLRGKKSFMHLLGLGLGLVLIIMQHEIGLALAFNGYLLVGLLNEVRYQLFPKHRPPEWIPSSEPELATKVGGNQAEPDGGIRPGELPREI